jgi:lysozyme family protein
MSLEATVLRLFAYEGYGAQGKHDNIPRLARASLLSPGCECEYQYYTYPEHH